MNIERRTETPHEEKSDLVFKDGRVGRKWFNWWSGRQGIHWFREEEIKELEKELDNN